MLSVPVRIVLGLGAGFLLVAVLHRVVTAPSARADEPAPSVFPPAGACLRSPWVLASVRGHGTWLVFLAARESDLPVSAAPVVKVESHGALSLLRPPPRAEVPGARFLASGVVLPCRDLAELAPTARAALLDVCGALAAGRGLAADQLVPRGLRGSRQARRALIRWQR